MLKKTATYFLLLAITLLLNTHTVFAQVLLDADSSGNAYNKISSILAPGNVAVEAPDQANGTHKSFGKHIGMVYDTILKKQVFEFYIHALNDNDVATQDSDRQRVEIKSYAPSPDNLKGTDGETITYTWYFKLPKGFQASPNFTHIHQIKGVGGDDSDPIFTITPNTSGSTSTMGVRYVADSLQGNSSNSFTKIALVSLKPFLGNWVKVTEKILVSTASNGSYSIVITNLATGATLLAAAKSNIKTMRVSNSFIRPKWGIYRSIKTISYLRDDSMQLASVAIFEGLPPATPQHITAVATSDTKIQLTWNDMATNEANYEIQQSIDGLTNWNSIATLNANTVTYADTFLQPSTIYYYRVLAKNMAGESGYSTIAQAKTLAVLPVKLLQIKANWVQAGLQIVWKTSKEINVKGYEMQLSTDGEKFESITFLPASNSVNYAYTCLKTSDATLYVRLKILDNDGTATYSQIVTVGGISSGWLRCFPNPVKDFVTISTNLTNQNDLLYVYGSNGKLYNKIFLAQNSVNLPVKSYPNGWYTVVVNNKLNKCATCSFVVLH